MQERELGNFHQKMESGDKGLKLRVKYEAAGEKLERDGGGIVSVMC